MLELQKHLMASLKDSLAVFQLGQGMEAQEERFRQYINDWGILNLLKSKDFMELDQSQLTLLRLLDQLLSAEN